MYVFHTKTSSSLTLVLTQTVNGILIMTLAGGAFKRKYSTGCLVLIRLLAWYFRESDQRCMGALRNAMTRSVGTAAIAAAVVAFVDLLREILGSTSFPCYRNCILLFRMLRMRTYSRGNSLSLTIQLEKIVQVYNKCEKIFCDHG